MSSQGRLPVPISPPAPVQAHDHNAISIELEMELEAPYYNRCGDGPYDIPETPSPCTSPLQEEEEEVETDDSIMLTGMRDSPISTDSMFSDEELETDVDGTELLCDEVFVPWVRPAIELIVTPFQLRHAVRW